MDAAELTVEVAYARGDKQLIVPVLLPAGATVADAIEAAEMVRHFPEIDLSHQRVGIFGKATTLDTLLRVGDRVEIYRPLIADPKAVRKARARAKSN